MLGSTPSDRYPHPDLQFRFQMRLHAILQAGDAKTRLLYAVRRSRLHWLQIILRATVLDLRRSKGASSVPGCIDSLRPHACLPPGARRDCTAQVADQRLLREYLYMLRSCAEKILTLSGLLGLPSRSGTLHASSSGECARLMNKIGILNNAFLPEEEQNY
jgi:hypothetical protein